MARQVQVCFDCADPALLSRFWAAALGYVVSEPPPPEGFATWPEALTAWKVPEAEWDEVAFLADPDGVGPRVFFQRVPEGKVVKNRWTCARRGWRPWSRSSWLREARASG
jgi:hypothetical protein